MDQPLVSFPCFTISHESDIFTCCNKEHLNALAISSDDESEQADLQPQPQPHIIHVL